MKFDYYYYRRALLFTAIGMLALGIILIGTTLYATIKGKPFANNSFLNNKFMRILIFMLSICASLFFITRSISELRYGIYLVKEKPEDALVIQGEIEEIKEFKNLFEHNYQYIRNDGEEFEKYTPLECNAHLITISGKKYYFMIKGELKVGDYVKISYLPKSTIVLEVNIIENK